MSPSHIVALGGGGWSYDHRGGPLDDYVLSLASTPVPRICLIPTAGGDSSHDIARFYEVFGERECVPTHHPLFRSHPIPAEERLADVDVVYVTGGSTLNLIALWRLHGVDRALRDLFDRGVVLAGVSAGAICWFEAGLSNSVGPGYARAPGLGLVRGGFCPHADGDPGRMPALRRLVAAGGMPETWAVDDHTALHLVDGRVEAAVSTDPALGARLVTAGGERAVPTTVIGAGVAQAVGVDGPAR
jgi:peptidase E